MKIFAIASWSALLCLGLTLVGCGLAMPTQTSATAEADIKYVQDKRTGLCFATTGPSFRSNTATLAHVPCNPGVIALIAR